MRARRGGLTGWRRGRTGSPPGSGPAVTRPAGCSVLLTEELGHDRDLDGVRVVSPFRAQPGSLVDGAR